MSSLSLQLAARTTLDSSRLASSQALRYPPSFIYTAKHAASISTPQLHQIASSAFDQLAAIDPLFDQFQDALFGEEAKGQDRALLTREENDRLASLLEKVLRCLGKHVLLKPAGIVLEWLVRRFRINDLSPSSLIILFLPYHTTAHFPSVLALIPTPLLAASSFSSLIPAQTSKAPLPLSSLIAFLPPFSAAPNASDLLIAITGLAKSYLEKGEQPHRALVGFWLQSMAAYLERAKTSLPSGERAIVLSAIMDVIKLCGGNPATTVNGGRGGNAGGKNEDSMIAAYILLARYTTHFPFSAESLRVILKSLATHRINSDVDSTGNGSNDGNEVDKAFMTTLVVICGLSDESDSKDLSSKERKFLGGNGWKGLMKIVNLDSILIQLSIEYNAERFMKPFLTTLIAESTTSAESLTLLRSLLVPSPTSHDDVAPTLLPDPIVDLLARISFEHLLSSVSPSASSAAEVLEYRPNGDSEVAGFEMNDGVLKVLKIVYQRWPTVWESITRSLLGSSPLSAVSSGTSTALTGSGTTSGANGSTTTMTKQHQKRLSLIWSIVHIVLSPSSSSLSINDAAANSPATTTATLPSASFLSSNSPSYIVRMQALKDLVVFVRASPTLLTSSALTSSALLEVVGEEGDDVGLRSFVQATLFARIGEADTAMMAYLLEDDDARMVLQSMLGAEDLLDALEKAISSSEGSSSKAKESERIVLAYLAGPFVEKWNEMAHLVMSRFFWGRLLLLCSSNASATLPTSAVGWNALRGSTLERLHPWFSAVDSSDFVLTFEAGPLAGANMVAQNRRMVDRLSSRIDALVAAERSSALDYLLDRISSSTSDNVGAYESQSRLCAILVLIALLQPASTTKGVARSGVNLGLVQQIVDLLNLERNGIDSFFPSASYRKSSSLAASSTTIGRLDQAIHRHAGDMATLLTAQRALIESAVASIRAVERISGSWLSPLPASSTTVLATYQRLIASLYCAAHTATTPPSRLFASATFLAPIFHIHAAKDTLSFLSSIFTNARLAQELRMAALKEVAVFVKCRSGGGDYQTLVPSLIVALQDEHVGVRQEAMKCIETTQEALILARSNAPVAVEGGKKKSGKVEIFGVEGFYGVETDQVQYLPTEDIAAYLSKLVDSKVELVMDAAYVSAFHSSILENAVNVSSTGVKKKDTLKFKILIYLLSHAVSSTSLSSRTLLLRSLSAIHDPLKSSHLLPLLQQVVICTAATRSAIFDGLKEEIAGEYCTLLVGGMFDGVSKKYLEGADNKPLDVFGQCLELSDDIGAGAVLRRLALKLVHTSVFAALRGENRLELFKRLVRLAALPDSRHFADMLACLRACKINGETMTAFFNEIRLSIAGPAGKNAKRGRTSATTATTPRADRLPHLVVALETVDFKSLAVTHGLLLALFDLLSTLIQISTATGVDIQYAGQLMLGTLSKVIDNIKADSGVTNDSIRMSPVLDLMRSSTNPQTSHQALLLLAQLGPLVPEQLVHNVMPIFTFMGSNILQRDDAYSLRVVERTLESIIPALVESMKTTSTSRDTLVAELRDLIRVFTDAASHVPRHRRIKLFVRFVETLGPQEFLSAVTMLLLDKNHANDASELPLAVVESFSVEIQLSTILHYIEESSRLLRRVPAGDADAPFLELSPVYSDDISPNQQVIALIRFTSIALESKQLLGKIDSARAAGSSHVDTSLSHLVRSLLDLTTVSSAKDPAKDLAPLATATSDSLQSTVRLMSTQAFSESLIQLLHLSDSSIRSSALGLLRSRLPSIKPTRRADISPAVVAVVDQIRAMLTDRECNHTEVEVALDTLSVVAGSVFADEDAALAKTVPVLIKIISRPLLSNAASNSVLSIVRMLSNRLGPRLIPLLSKLISFAVSILKREAQNALLDSRNTVASAFQIIEGLFTSIPTFIGSHLDIVFSACLSPEILGLTSSKEGSAAKARASLISTASKRLPAKTIYPAIIRLHASLDNTRPEPMIGLMDLLNRALRQGNTAEIAESYRSIFKLFLTVFDLRRVHSKSLTLDNINDIEENALGAFVQFILKLNEQTFRPIFLRTYDWAVIDLADQTDSTSALAARRTILYKLVDRLLVQLKAIVVPYYSFMLDQTIELMDAFAAGDLRDSSLWSAVTSSLTKAINLDENGFWTPLRLGKLSNVMAAQLQSPHPLSSSLVANYYHPLLAQYAQALAPHEDLLKTFNTSLLMLTRSDDLKIKKAALEAMELMWETLGDGMLGLVPETTPFLAELIEETEGGVEEVCRRLIKTLEAHLGESLDSYLGS